VPRPCQNAREKGGAGSLLPNPPSYPEETVDPDDIQKHARQLQDRRDRLAGHALQSGITPDGDEPKRDWADRLSATPPGHISLHTKNGPVTRPTGSLTPAQIATIQANQTEYGTEIEWALTLDDTAPIKSGRPSEFTLAWTDTKTGRVHVATWRRDGSLKNEGQSEGRLPTDD
jgi:hypothetical protein